MNSPGEGDKGRAQCALARVAHLGAEYRTPAGTQWIYVGDRGSDIFRFWQRCQELGYDFLTRVAQNRNVQVCEEEEQEDPTAEHLKTLARSWPSQGGRVLTVPAERGRPEREALVNIS